jgi:ABC-2 type transport system permease protein
VTLLAGTTRLTRLVLRRDRVRIALWIIAIAGFVVVAASGIKGAFPTASDLEAGAIAVSNSASQIALNGPAQGLDTLGGRVAFEVWNFGLIGVALMSLLMVGRHTRAEEESGRTELVRAMPVGRHAPAAAALAVVAGMNLAVGSAVAFALIAQDLPASGALVLGAAFAAVGVVFAAVAAVAAQVTENTRVANGITGAVLGLAFVVRAIGDVGDGTVSWLSPLGWAQASRPFAGERWWPLVVSLGAAIALVACAAALVARRDVGAGLVPARPGPAAASSGLGGPLGLALRLQRGSVIGWSVGLFLGGLALGSIGQDVEDLAGMTQDVRDVIAQAGGSLTDSFFATFLMVLALIAGGFAIGSAQRMRSEESALRAEPVLATAVSRRRWAGSHLTVALVGSVAALAAGGLGTGLAYGIVSRDLSEAPRLLGSALAYTPAVWVLAGLTVGLFGLLPPALATAWAGLGISLVIGVLGQMLEFPNWLMDVSPFEHTPLVPAAAPTVAPLVILVGIAASLAAIGLIGFSRRDVG